MCVYKIHEECFKGHICTTFSTLTTTSLYTLHILSSVVLFLYFYFYKMIIPLSFLRDDSKQFLIPTFQRGLRSPPRYKTAVWYSATMLSHGCIIPGRRDEKVSVFYRISSYHSVVYHRCHCTMITYILFDFHRMTTTVQHLSRARLHLATQARGVWSRHGGEWKT
jgi:hypothetical protein